MLFRKYRAEFEILEALNVFSRDHAGDLFSLIETYRHCVEDDLSAHYREMFFMKKKKTTKCPSVPSSMRRRHMFLNAGTKSTNYLRPLAAAEIEYCRQVGAAHCPHEESSCWEIDPIATHLGRERRTYLLSRLRSKGSGLHIIYVAHRAFTRAYIENDSAENDGVAAVEFALDAVSAFELELDAARVAPLVRLPTE